MLIRRLHSSLNGLTTLWYRSKLLTLLPLHFVQTCTLENDLLWQFKQGFTFLFFIKNLCIAQYCECFKGFLLHGLMLPIPWNTQFIFYDSEKNYLLNKENISFYRK